MLIFWCCTQIIHPIKYFFAIFPSKENGRNYYGVKQFNMADSGKHNYVEWLTMEWIWNFLQKLKL